MPSFLKFAILVLFLHGSSSLLNGDLFGAQVPSEHANPQNRKPTPPPSYVDKPLDQLIQTIPEIKTLQPSQDQTPLAMILDRCVKNIDAQFKDFGNLIAKEKVLETRYNPTLELSGQQRARSYEPLILENDYNYFIAREGTMVETRIREYRRDRYGSDGSQPHTAISFMATPGMTFLSANFASSLLYFSSDLRGEETFRYLGEQQIGSQTAYVVAFAQVPGIATSGISMKTPKGDESNWLVQGIAWIDKSTFNILQMRTDLFVPLDSASTCQQSQNPQNGGDVDLGMAFPNHNRTGSRAPELQTFLQFAQVQPNGSTHSMWLPTEADVNEHVGDCENPLQIARNVHHFSEYRLSDREGDPYSAGQIAAHPYLELPLTQIIKRIPELKGISSAPDQRALSSILQQTGQQVDAFFANLVDLIAHEDITQQRLGNRTLVNGMPGGSLVQAEQHTHDNYLILRRTAADSPHVEEFRLDKNGNRIDETGTERGFFVTSGFALSSIYFATRFQWGSRFLYLGDQKINGHETYVVAFAQLPSEAKVAVTIRGKDGSSVRLLSQGIAWVDKASFHIRRLRTDLLAALPELGLAEQTTKIGYSEVRFADRAPLWLPHDVNVNVQFREHLGQAANDVGTHVTEQTFSNSHHYSDYLLYRVSGRIGETH
jgi:hypothetical protein